MTRPVEPSWSGKSVRSGRGPARPDSRKLQKAAATIALVAAEATAILGLTFGGPVSAQVLDVQPDGAVARITGPVQTLDGVTHPIGEIATAPARSAVPAGLPTLFQDASDRSQLSARLIEAVAWEESRMNQAAVSPKGARGLMQLRPGVAASLGVDSRDLRSNLNGGATYLAELMKQFNGDIILSLAAYNAGPAAVRRWGGVPPYPETRAYVAAVLDRLAQTAPTSTPMSR
jgi:hypothetical protein